MCFLFVFSIIAFGMCICTVSPSFVRRDFVSLICFWVNVNVVLFSFVASAKFVFVMLADMLFVAFVVLFILFVL
uniref:Uncharacterized protein n=1 Tax=Octopus bimaculoides TaxID=37653 RepID=A0A0L8HT62_OCTBM